MGKSNSDRDALVAKDPFVKLYNSITVTAAEPLQHLLLCCGNSRLLYRSTTQLSPVSFPFVRFGRSGEAAGSSDDVTK